MKNYALSIVMAILILSACGDNTGRKTLSNGFEYQIYTNQPGTIPAAGDVVTLDLEVINDKGITIDDSRDVPTDPVFQIPKQGTPDTDRNPLLSLLKLCRTGDSASVYVPIDSLPNHPPSFAGSELIEYRMKIHSIETPEAYRIRKDGEIKLTVEKEQAIAKNAFDTYIKGDSEGEIIDITDTGIKVTLLRNTGRAKVQQGNSVSVDYFGFFRDGESFDNSAKAGRPFTFKVGTQSAIQGWDLAMPYIPEGSSAIIDIPYEYAYGSQGSPPAIPAYTDLIFYVTVVRVFDK